MWIKDIYLIRSALKLTAIWGLNINAAGEGASNTVGKGRGLGRGRRGEIWLIWGGREG